MKLAFHSLPPSWNATSQNPCTCVSEVSAKNLAVVHVAQKSMERDVKYTKCKQKMQSAGSHEMHNINDIHYSHKIIHPSYIDILILKIYDYL